MIMKKVLKGLAIAGGIIVAALVLMYFLVGIYYMNGFPCFTWINGVYCTGKSVQEVNNELVMQDGYTGIAVLGRDGENIFVSADDVDLKIDYTNVVSHIYQKRSPFMWGVYLLSSRDYHYEPSAVTLDGEKLRQIVTGWEIFKDPKSFECKLIKTDDEGYVLKDEFVTLPDPDNVVKLVNDSMISREELIDLSQYDNCYRTYDLRSNSVDDVELYRRISPLQEMSLTYRIGDDEVVFGGSEVSEIILTKDDYAQAAEEKSGTKVLGAGRFIIDGKETQLPGEDSIKVVEGIITDEDGNPIISEKKLYAFLEGIATKYDTRNMMEMYRKGESRTVVLNRNSRGNSAIIDIASEFDYLKNMVMNCGNPDGEEPGNGQPEEDAAGSSQDEDRQPDVRELALSDNIIVVDAQEQLGNTYIEIDMGQQELNYYVDGKLDMSFPIVTGCTNRGRGTPAGIFKIYNKRYHTYLRGADYVSYVNYWLGVHKGIGIHDATWRSKFGGELYRSEGSHGCINCPLDQAGTLWEKVEVDTPVILYY